MDVSMTRGAWPAGGRRVPWTKLLIALLAAYSLLHLGCSIAQYNPITYPYVSGDFRRTYEEMLEWRARGSLHAKHVQHPPLYYVLLWPLASLPFPTVAKLLYVSQWLWYALAIAVMARSASASSRPSAGDYLLATLLTVNFQPFLETAALHKVEGLELLVICLAIELFRRGRDALAGAAVVLGANLKYLPGILALYFLVKRERRAIVGMLAAAVVCLAVSVVALSDAGWTAVLRYPLLMFDRQHDGNRPEANMEFQTLNGTVNRWFVDTDGMQAHFRTVNYVPVSDPALAFSLAAVLKLGCVLWYLYAMRRRWSPAERGTRWPVILCELSLTLLLIFIIAQASRVHYAILLLPAFVSTALLLRRYPHVLGWPERWLFIAAYGLTAILIPGGLLNRLPPSSVWGSHHSFAYLWFSLPFYGYLLLGVCLIRCRARLLRAGAVAAGTPVVGAT